MVKLGEVEFLVKFDTVGQSFKDVLKDALGDQDLDIDFTDIQDELRYIRSYLGVLKTPFSGSYEVDIIKKRAYVKELESEEYFEKIVNLAKVSETILGYFTGEKGKVKAGTEEAESIAREGVEIAFKRILDFMNKAFASPITYQIEGDKINKILKMFEAGTETAMNYLMGTALKFSITEADIDRKLVEQVGTIIDESGDELGEDTEEQVEATITKEKGLFNRIKIRLEKTEESLDDSWDHIIKKQGDFTKAIDEFISKENIKELLTSQAVEFKGSLREEIEEMLKYVTFEVADVIYPQGFLKTVVAIKDDLKLMGDIVSRERAGAVPDVRALMTNFEDAWEVIEKFTVLTKEKDIQKLKEDVKEAFDTFGWLFMLWENKKWASLGEMQQDLQKYPEEMRPLIMGAAAFGTGGVTVKPELADIPATKQELIELAKEEEPEKIKMGIENLLEKITNVLGVSQDIWGSMPGIGDSLKELLEVLKSRPKIQLGESL